MGLGLQKKSPIYNYQEHPESAKQYKKMNDRLKGHLTSRLVDKGERHWNTHTSINPKLINKNHVFLK